MIGLGLGIAGIVLPTALWAYRKYMAIRADGKVTLSEVIDAVKEGASKMSDAKEQIDDEIEKAKGE